MRPDVRERSDLVLDAEQGEKAAKRDYHEAEHLIEREVAHVGFDQPETSSSRGLRGLSPRDLQHGGRRVEADDLDSCLRDGDGYPARAAPELQHGAAGATSLINVEGDVLRDVGVHGVVDLGPLVERGGHCALAAAEVHQGFADLLF